MELRWCRTRLSKTHTVSHRAEFGFTAVFWCASFAAIPLAVARGGNLPPRGWAKLCKAESRFSSSVQYPQGGRLGFEEALILHLGNLLPHCVGAHACAFSNFSEARVAQVRLPILAKIRYVYTAISPARFFLASPSHIFSAGLLPVFQILFREAFFLFTLPQILRVPKARFSVCFGPKNFPQRQTSTALL